MADILIRIEKPKNCFLCRFFREVQDYDGTFACCIAARKEINWNFDDCLFPSLPEGHGRLGDLDKIVSFIDYYERPMDRDTSPFKALSAVRDYICNDSNTIILAEGENADGD